MNAAAKDYGRVGVLMGGWSAEREISLVSGRAVLAALETAGVDARGVDFGRDACDVLASGGFDRVFIALHGRTGEDGCIQGLLDILDLPYTGSGVVGSAVCMDKVTTKRIWNGSGLPTPAFTEFDAGTDPEFLAQRVGFPLIVKPALEGSSLGMRKVDLPDQVSGAHEQAAGYRCPVMAEAWVTGTEYTVAILDGAALPMIRLETPREFYDYEAKYRAIDTQYIIPCGLSPRREREIQDLSLAAFRVTGATGWGRVDLLIDGQGDPWLIEVNTVPGMTDHSLVPMAAAAGGLSFGQLVLRILDTAGTGK
ncbi:MAG: D-alanine--D-alanine ligase [Pseudomonadota bacterium]|nr:D-alanine--D-alanine ligase [Pseudomonadota bacterium]